ncbi:hypothetical protein IQ250_21635 [Pseudanabaenaceae cyanobacterium LEGE 13415]|nr:hypothetical protein [Pseudanabaenaceae cyanobacterium LEGE 13415]
MRRLRDRPAGPIASLLASAADLVSDALKATNVQLEGASQKISNFSQEVNELNQKMQFNIEVRAVNRDVKVVCAVEQAFIESILGITQTLHHLQRELDADPQFKIMYEKVKQMEGFSDPEEVIGGPPPERECASPEAPLRPADGKIADAAQGEFLGIVKDHLDYLLKVKQRLDRDRQFKEAFEKEMARRGGRRVYQRIEELGTSA